jgi:hypothetical protein
MGKHELCAYGLKKENAEKIGMHTHHPTWAWGYWVSLEEPYKYSFLPDVPRCDICLAECSANTFTDGR